MLENIVLLFIYCRWNVDLQHLSFAGECPRVCVSVFGLVCSCSIAIAPIITFESKCIYLMNTLGAYNAITASCCKRKREMLQFFFSQSSSSSIELQVINLLERVFCAILCARVSVYLLLVLVLTSRLFLSLRVCVFVHCLAGTKAASIESALQFDVVVSFFFCFVSEKRMAHRMHWPFEWNKECWTRFGIRSLIFLCFVHILNSNGIRYGRKHLHRTSVWGARANKIESTIFSFNE